MSSSKSESDNKASWWALGLGVAAVVAYVLLQLLIDVFSLEGLAYTLGHGDGSGLMWPEATAALTWALMVECCAVSGMVSNYLAGRWKNSLTLNVAAGHTRFLRWIGRALQAAGTALYRGCCWVLRQASRPVLAEPADLDDFESVVDDSAQAA